MGGFVPQVQSVVFSSANNNAQVSKVPTKMSFMNGDVLRNNRILPCQPQWYYQILLSKVFEYKRMKALP